MLLPGIANVGPMTVNAFYVKSIRECRFNLCNMASGGILDRRYIAKTVDLARDHESKGQLGPLNSCILMWHVAREHFDGVPIPWMPFDAAKDMPNHLPVDHPDVERNPGGLFIPGEDGKPPMYMAPPAGAVLQILDKSGGRVVEAVWPDGRTKVVSTILEKSSPAYARFHARKAGAAQMPMDDVFDREGQTCKHCGVTSGELLYERDIDPSSRKLSKCSGCMASTP